MNNAAGILKSFLNNLKIRRQLYIVYFLAGLLPILIVGSYLIINTRHLVLNQHYSQATADNLRVRSIMLDVTTSLSNMSDEIFSDMQLQAILTGSYANLEESYAACRAYTKMNSYVNNYTEISKMTLYVNNNTISNYGHFERATEEIQQTEWYQRAKNTVGGYQWMTVTVLDRGGNALSELQLTRKIPIYGTNNFAVLVISTNNNNLKSRIDTGSLKTEVSVNANPIFYSNIRGNNGRMPGMAIDGSAQFYKFSGITTYNGNNEMIEVSTLIPIKSHDNVYIITIDDNALPSTNKILRICLSIVLFSLTTTLVMVIVFSKTFSSRIITLRQEMHKVSCGNYNIIEDFNGNDELVDLFTDLKSMIESIKSMDAEIYNSRITKQKLINHQQEMQFEMLASQINPHFLYNTLETIRMKAYNAGNKEVATAIKLLGKSMRHVLETTGRPATLSSELEYVRIYLEIQKLRFHDRLDYDITVAEDIAPGQYMILPLLLQPIVENAIIHGLENKENGGFIQISMFSEDDRLVVSVTDDGVGMSESELSSLLEKMRSTRENAVGSIGLYNIYQRIVLYYGEKYGVDIKSEPNVGTQVRAYLPLESSVKDKGQREEWEQ